MKQNTCVVCGKQFEASKEARFCGSTCRSRAYRGGLEVDKESLPPETFSALELKAMNTRLDAMASFLKEFEARVIEMSNKYYGLANFVYKATAELKKGSGDPEKSVVEYQ